MCIVCKPKRLQLLQWFKMGEKSSLFLAAGFLEVVSVVLKAYNWAELSLGMRSAGEEHAALSVPRRWDFPALWHGAAPLVLPGAKRQPGKLSPEMLLEPEPPRIQRDCSRVTAYRQCSGCFAKYSSLTSYGLARLMFQAVYLCSSR